MENGLYIFNIGSVNFNHIPGFNLEARVIHISPKRDGSPLHGMPNSRYITGLTNGGLSVFRMWIDNDQEIEFKERTTNATIKAGDKYLTLHRDAGDKFGLLETDESLSSSELDELILKHYNSPNYAIVMYVRREQAVEASKQADWMRHYK
jgi:hypothetical protein